MIAVIEWCNDNQGFLSIILALFALGISTVAIIITLINSKKQKNVERANININLLDRRIEIYDYFLNIIYNINDEMLRLTRSYYDYNGKEDLDFLFLGDIDFFEYPLYFNNDVCLKSEYVMKLRIAKSIFGKEFEDVINEYINRAIAFANNKVAFDKFVDKHGIDKLKDKIWVMFRSTKEKNTSMEERIMGDEEMKLLEEMPKLSAIAEEYTPFLVVDRKFEKFIEKHLDIDLV